MTGARSRAALSARACVLDRSAHGDLSSPRARRLLQRLAPAASASSVSFADIAAAPEWIGWPQDRRGLLAAVTGAVLCSAVLRRMIDGAALGRIARNIGPSALDAILSLPGPMARPFVDETARSGDVEALARLGQAALLRSLAARPALQARMAALAPQTPSGPATREAEAAVGIALGLVTSGQAIGALH